MTENSPNTNTAELSDALSNTRRRVGWLLLAYYIWILPINLWTLLPRSDLPFSLLMLELLMFATTAAMLAVARNSLQTFRIDRISLLLFLLFGTFLRIARDPTNSTETGLTYCLFLPIALVLMILLFRSRSAGQRWAPVRWQWLGVGLVFGVSLGLIILGASSLLAGRASLPPPKSGLAISSVVFTLLYSMGHTVILEEPAGRGFLWGFLEQWQWRPTAIWLAQAAIFWLGHLRFIDTPLTFWLALPAGGLMLGWLSWKSGSVAAGIVAHAAYNTIGAFY